jgi:hypothetical protein
MTYGKLETMMISNIGSALNFFEGNFGGIKRDPHLHFIPQIPEGEPPVGGRATPFTDYIGALHEYICDYMRREALQDSNSAESFFGIRPDVRSK